MITPPAAATQTDPLRVTFLTIMPSPYTRDLFAAMHADGRIVPRVLYMEMTAPDTKWGTVALPEYSTVLRGGWRNFGGGRIHWNPGVLRAIRETRPDAVVVAGYSSLTAQLVMRWLRWKRWPWIFWGEIPGMRSLGGWKERLRSLARYPAVAWPRGIAAIGSRAVEEYRRLAPSRCKVANIPYYTDLTPFLDQPARRSAGEIRLLYCGQLIERKGLDNLCEAFFRLADELPQLTLQLVGDGPQRDSLLQRVPEKLKSRVSFAGFQPVEKLPEFFAGADLFVLPSKHDGWGVVVNQALAAGLPLICTETVGAAHDLIQPGQNGFIVPVDDRTALAQAIRTISADAALRSRFAAQSRQSAQDWVPARGVGRWVELVRSVIMPRETSCASP